MGAMHVYLEQGRFRQADFDFAISLANIAAVALARARRESRLHTDYLRLVDQSPGHSEMIGESRPMRELKSKINRLARATGCVLIRGESGVGKELVARALHRASQRADRPMLSVNCAAIPADLMESQLFGHKAGSFTGADRDHTGYFQQADLGTLFLDEVGEMTLEGQAKLLRILEGHPFLPVGATEEMTVDVRVIAATNQDLQHYVREKKFREDLYYRLSVFELLVPPLRERGEDIGLLIDFFLDHFRRQHGRPTLGNLARSPGEAVGLSVAGKCAATAQRHRQRRRAGRRRPDRSRRSRPARRRQRRTGIAGLGNVGKAADRRGPAPHRRQRAGRGATVGHRPRDFVS